MGKLGGVCLLFSGLGAAGYLWVTEPPASPATSSVAEVTSIATSGSTPSRAETPVLPLPSRSFSTREPLATSVATPAAPPGAPQSAQVAPDARPIPLTPRSAAPGDDDAKKGLTRDIQRELKRVGCYDGDVDGVWSQTTRRAMSSFTERVNATLPVTHPDFILLTLVQGHKTTACGRGCPAGQGLNADGRCIPQAIIAKSAKKPEARPVKRVDDGRREDTRREDTRRDDGRRPAEPAIAFGPPVVTPAPDARIEPLRTVEPPRAVEPLPGRMTVGGPGGPSAGEEKKRADKERIAAERAGREARARAEAELKVKAAAAAAQIADAKAKADADLRARAEAARAVDLKVKADVAEAEARRRAKLAAAEPSPSPRAVASTLAPPVTGPSATRLSVTGSEAAIMLPVTPPAAPVLPPAARATTTAELAAPASAPASMAKSEEPTSTSRKRVAIRVLPPAEASPPVARAATPAPVLPSPPLKPVARYAPPTYAPPSYVVRAPAPPRVYVPRAEVYQRPSGASLFSRLQRSAP